MTREKLQPYIDNLTTDEQRAEVAAFVDWRIHNKAMQSVYKPNGAVTIIEPGKTPLWDQNFHYSPIPTKPPMEVEGVSQRATVFSPCRLYRYTLWREWDCDSLTGCADDLPNVESYLMVIGLNPSTADETKDDPTIRRCVNFAKRWGYGALCMTNLFAWRDTKPANMKRAHNPVGEDNHHHLLSCAASAGLVLAAWGKNGSFQNQDINVRQWLSSIGVPIYCLRKNGDGSPEHPLYVPAETTPILL